MGQGNKNRKRYNTTITTSKSSVSDKESPFWIGKVVSFEAQKEQTSGVKAWGIRYKVRLMGDYSDKDDVEDKDIIYATSALGVTDGSGAKNMLKSSKISQGDTVMGIFLSADEQGPIIQNVLPRSAVEKRGGGKFDAKSGFTDQTKAGLLGNQEFNEQDNVATPGLKDCKGSQKGGGKGRGIPLKGLQKMGIDPNLPSQVNAIKKPIVSSTQLSNILDPNKEVILPNAPQRSDYPQTASGLREFTAAYKKHVGKSKTKLDIVEEMKSQGNAAAYTEIESVKGGLTNRDRFLIKDKMRIEELATTFLDDNVGPGKDFETSLEATESPQYQTFLDQVEVIDEELNN